MSGKGIEIAYVIGHRTFFKCRCCETILGSQYDFKPSAEMFEKFVYCPYCGIEL